MAHTSMKISGLAGALLLSLAACSSSGSGSDSSASDSGSTPSPSVETSSSEDATSTSPDLNVDDVATSWNFPESIDGYTIGIYDQDGMFQATKDNGCQVFTYQAQVTGATGSEREHSEEFQDEYMASLTRRGLINVNYEESSDNYVTSEDGDEVEGVASDVTYTASDGVEYKGWYWYRHFDDDVMPVSLMANLTCPEGEYSPEEAEKLFSEDLHIEGLSAEDKNMDG
ncbi:MAG: hypothetical protein Q3979_09235 [Actinomycetaceae bacterium]|nr:hypothetical protein [Actinomycetaceae bacterium]